MDERLKGAMYQDIAQTLDLPIVIGEDTLLMEPGFHKRKSQMVNLTYRI